MKNDFITHPEDKKYFFLGFWVGLIPITIYTIVFLWMAKGGGSLLFALYLFWALIDAAVIVFFSIIYKVMISRYDTYPSLAGIIGLLAGVLCGFVGTYLINLIVYLVIYDEWRSFGLVNWFDILTGKY